MKRSLIYTVVFTILFVDAAAQENSGRDSPSIGTETTIQDQSDVAVTVYNNNLALVRDRRNVVLSTGEVDLTFSDVAQQIMPETVSIESVTQPGSIRILEQNYEFDLLSPSKLLEKYVGKRVKLGDRAATLLSVNEYPVYEIDGEIHIGHQPYVVVPDVPENLIAKPSLIWKLNNNSSNQELEATYLTRGLSWKADYVIKLDRDDTNMSLDAWVTLNNQSGAPYTDAQLKLVAGEVNIVPQYRQGGMAGRAVAMESMAMDAMAEESFAEYHLYSLPRRTTIKENQSKQVSLFTASDISVKKVYEFRGQLHYYSQRIPQPTEQKVGVMLVFQNEEANSLGVPLPAGIMRIYQEDSDGMLQFAGEDRVDHTPKDEEVRLRMGNAFDIVAERIQTDYNVVGSQLFEAGFEITVRNHKDTAVTVDVIEPMPADWTMLNESRPHVKKDAHTAVYSIPVEPDGRRTAELSGTGSLLNLGIGAVRKRSKP